MLNIVIPMAGRGSRFADAGYSTPKPLIPIGGRPMIDWVVDYLRPSRSHRFTFICQAAHLQEYPEVAEHLHTIAPSANIVALGGVTEGAACTVLAARDIFDSSDPLMIANSDQFVDLNVDDYLSAGDALGNDGLIMSFWSDDPKWSYCRMRPDGSVGEVVEKEVVSNVATVGIYNFHHGHDFARAADKMIARDLRVRGEFYVAPVYNLLIEEGLRFQTVDTGREGDGMYGLGIPEDLHDFLQTDTYHDIHRQTLAEVG